jgi:uncharacterized RDD family membrane protein YckC
MYEARPAGFWIRAVALGIDALVLMLVDRSLGVVAWRMWGATAEDTTLLHGMIALFTLAFAGLYVILLHAAAGQTIGKMVVRAHVVLLDGEAVPVGTSLLRFCAYTLSSLPLGLGYAMAGLRHDKRALHDLIAGTRVERRLPALVEPSQSPSESVIPPAA